jgi:hypothetical protein
VQDPTVAAARGGKYCPLFKIRAVVVKRVAKLNVNSSRMTNPLMHANVMHSLAKNVYSFHRSTMQTTMYEFSENETLIELEPLTWLFLTDVVGASEKRNDTKECDEDWKTSSIALIHSLHARIVCPRLSHLDFLLHGPLKATRKSLGSPSNDD